MKLWRRIWVLELAYLMWMRGWGWGWNVLHEYYVIDFMVLCHLLLRKRNFEQSFRKIREKVKFTSNVKVDPPLPECFSKNGASHGEEQLHFRIAVFFAFSEMNVPNVNIPKQLFVICILQTDNLNDGKEGWKFRNSHFLANLKILPLKRI